jgi:hypothetical protein
MSTKVFSIIGPIQGDNERGVIDNQAYRNSISELLRSYLPSWTEYEPHTEVMKKGKALAERGMAPLEPTPYEGVFTPRKLLREVSADFLEATRKVGSSDLVVCHLPGRKLSMGTAMELYSSKLHGAKVIAITDLTDNLALLSTVDVFVKDRGQLGNALGEIGLA